MHASRVSPFLYGANFPVKKGRHKYSSRLYSSMMKNGVGSQGLINGTRACT